MKKIVVLASLCLPALALADNTINFQGEVTSQTCTVDINGNATSPLVLLPTVPTTSLAKTGDVAGETDFTIRLTGCEAAPAGGTKINTVFVANSLTTGGNIGNVGSAGKVALQLLDPAAPATPFNLTGGYKAPGLELKAGETTAEHKFAVRYYAEDTVTAGSVLGSVQYAVSYL
ncbi:major type 1 subunit fimbrin (pilin) [Chromobacterium alkanivorans]|uniref:fimbrial protein n=1 Tax=Chromobacterium TaxID=535 RepID=UPI000652B4F7|nr:MULTISPECIES: fimbrial protein [Chromobacterium]KMN79993.1 fimbrial protein [Chromobacterium sp. LK11]MBN3005524.1 type 1 fimbrial protein [Chromobacterium alkanivorans]MCS3806384.1 major type 1 subunit fimbrin (pilin) [Chromobacterium alkanivorans]MCS3820604.1 major type 1 subunit fimbrin (pilin) [Chromobacterium alkanivorans]MCS3875362.1 major type 1 subunit fimbrin (pilin) [Chromobacterium alkanivorans]